MLDIALSESGDDLWVEQEVSKCMHSHISHGALGSFHWIAQHMPLVPPPQTLQGVVLNGGCYI